MEKNVQMFSIFLSVKLPCIKKDRYDDTSYVRGKNQTTPHAAVTPWKQDVKW